jgi:hypothetical protein
MIKFLKGPVVAAGTAALAWWTWDKHWAGIIPALAFMAAFYTILWMGYTVAVKGIGSLWRDNAKRSYENKNKPVR